MRKGPAIATIAAAAALLALLAYGVFTTGADNSIDDAVAKGERPEAESTRLPVLQGRGEGSLDDYRGKVVLLNFWASWCPPCVDELPLLQRTQRQIEPRGATVLGVNYKDIPEDATDMVRRFGVSYPSLRDRDGDYAENFAAVGFPETFVIDRRGRIAAVQRGPVTQGWLDETLPPLLEERSS